MLPIEFEASTGHDLKPSVVDASYMLCRFCGHTYEIRYIMLLLPTDLMTEPECKAATINLPNDPPARGCTCGVGQEWLEGHSFWCNHK